MNDVSENMARNIRFFRLKKGLTQDQVGAFIGGLCRAAVSHWETGKSRPDVRSIPRLCDLLGISYGTLFGSDSSDGSFDNHSNPQGELADAARADEWRPPFNARAADINAVLERLRQYTTEDHRGCRAPHELINAAVEAIETLIDQRDSLIQALNTYDENDRHGYC
jgi:transcriptional regulator with XRE-family HTH domain